MAAADRSRGSSAGSAAATHSGKLRRAVEERRVVGARRRDRGGVGAEPYPGALVGLPNLGHPLAPLPHPNPPVGLVLPPATPLFRLGNLALLGGKLGGDRVLIGGGGWAKRDSQAKNSIQFNFVCGRIHPDLYGGGGLSVLSGFPSTKVDSPNMTSPKFSLLANRQAVDSRCVQPCLSQRVGRQKVRRLKSLLEDDVRRKESWPSWD
ncbi:toll-like receptor 9 [Striga asiatica]|uniref:Toll-like receptor 9 n=1 Tax=Striga asiatica TaxID=4170 RepID=A0A5A7PB53_STRAF|nr:toll-like receptor 9 [Striga asiatica]